MTNTTNKEKPGFWSVVGRGYIGKCPNCGKGSLFRKYLKHVDRCDKCGEEFGHIRADDGPAWLTILLVGHIIALILAFAPGNNWSVTTETIFWCSLAVILALILLPRSKGLFIGLIWRMGCSGSEK